MNAMQADVEVVETGILAYRHRRPAKQRLWDFGEWPL